MDCHCGNVYFGKERLKWLQLSQKNDQQHSRQSEHSAKRLFENNYISITKNFEKITPKQAVVSPKLGSEPLLLTLKPSNLIKILTCDPVSFKGYSGFANSFQQSIPKNRGAIIYLLLNSS